MYVWSQQERGRESRASTAMRCDVMDNSYVILPCSRLGSLSFVLFFTFISFLAFSPREKTLILTADGTRKADTTALRIVNPPYLSILKSGYAATCASLRIDVFLHKVRGISTHTHNMHCIHKQDDPTRPNCSRILNRATAMNT